MTMDNLIGGRRPPFEKATGHRVAAMKDDGPGKATSLASITEFLLGESKTYQLNPLCPNQ